MTLRYDKRIADDFAALLALYPDDELPKITRSTVPLLAYWRTFCERVPSYLSQLGVEQSASVSLHFELTVPSAVISTTGRPNRPSHTDLMIFTDNLAVAIEGKWMEPRYETVRDWRGIEQTENKLGVIDHWLSMIGERIGMSLSRDERLLRELRGCKKAYRLRIGRAAPGELARCVSRMLRKRFGIDAGMRASPPKQFVQRCLIQAQSDRSSSWYAKVRLLEGAFVTAAARRHPFGWRETYRSHSFPGGKPHLLHTLRLQQSAKLVRFDFGILRMTAEPVRHYDEGFTS